jgi:hypothetical protein
MISAVWRKSSHSLDQGNCVEVAFVDSRVGLRDSKTPGLGHVVVGGVAWCSLVEALAGTPARPGGRAGA